MCIIRTTPSSIFCCALEIVSWAVHPFWVPAFIPICPLLFELLRKNFCTVSKKVVANGWGYASLEKIDATIQSGCKTART